MTLTAALVVTLVQLAKYGVVSIGEMVAGLASMEVLWKKGGWRWWAAFVVSQLYIGVAAFFVRKYWVF